MSGSAASVLKWGERKKLAPKHFTVYQRGIKIKNFLDIFILMLTGNSKIIMMGYKKCPKCYYHENSVGNLKDNNVNIIKGE